MKAKDIINLRNTLTTAISKNWTRIYLENVVKKGETRNYDMKAVYNEIIKDGIKVVKAKLAQAAMNLGFKNLESLPESNMYGKIYMLSQLKEQRVKLVKIPTKGGSAEITKKFIDNEVKSIDMRIVEIEEFLEKQNEELDFEFEMAA